MTQRSFTTPYFHTLPSTMLLHFKWQNQTISKLVSKLIQQLCILIVINMHSIKEALLLSCSQSQKREKEENKFFDIMSLLKQCQGIALVLFSYKKTLRPSGRCCFSFLME